MNGDDLDYFGTVRARLGYAFDRVLVYGTGGFAYSDERGGWTAGGGVEYALPGSFLGSTAITIGVEGLYVNLDRGNDDRHFFGGPFFGGNNGDDTEFGVVRAKLNLKF